MNEVGPITDRDLRLIRITMRHTVEVIHTWLNNGHAAEFCHLEQAVRPWTFKDKFLRELIEQVVIEGDDIDAELYDT